MNKQDWKNSSKLNNQFNDAKIRKRRETSNEWWTRRLREEALEKERRLKEEKEQEELKKLLESKETMDSFMLPLMTLRDGKDVLETAGGKDWVRAVKYADVYANCIEAIKKHVPDIQFHRSLINIDVYTEGGLAALFSRR